mmetsp:Transcript_25667/g.42964  ORF Transcript_25667/g.42964 Transcript_25667/m.42964 type:complete len:410 (-) Transcript_25667:62-1291(-)
MPRHVLPWALGTVVRKCMLLLLWLSCKPDIQVLSEVVHRSGKDAQGHAALTSHGAPEAPQKLDVESFAAAGGPRRRLSQLFARNPRPPAVYPSDGSAQSSGTYTLKFPDKAPKAKFANSIVVVGNGQSVLSTGLGARIDEFEEVVRFNFYQTRGFEPDVGSKTTTWVMAQIKDPKDTPDDGRLMRVRKIICPYLYRGLTCSKNVNKPCKVPADKKSLVEGKLEALHQKYDNLDVGKKTTVTLMEETDVLYTKYNLYEKYPSSGLQALTYFTQYYKKVYYVGFGFGSGDHDHYFEKKMKNETCHNMRDEARIIQAMEAEGILERLDPQNADVTRIPNDRLYTSVRAGYDPFCKIVCGVKGPEPNMHNGKVVPYGVCLKVHAPDAPPGSSDKPIERVVNKRPAHKRRGKGR